MKMNFYEEMAVKVNIITESCFSKWSVEVGDTLFVSVLRMGGPMNKQSVSTILANLFTIATFLILHALFFFLF